MKRINRLLKDLNLLVMGAITGIWYEQMPNWYWVWPICAGLLILSDQFEMSVENGYINSLLRGQKSDK